MRYSFAAVLALASSVLAQTPGFNVISKPGNFEDVPAGSTYSVVWSPSPAYSGKSVTVSLIGGKDQGSLQPIETLGKATVDDGKFEWKVDSKLGDKAIYGVVITLDENKETFQYSFPFHIAGSGAGSSGSATSWATGTTSTASSNSTITKTSASSYHTMTPSGNLSSIAPTGKMTTLVSTTAKSSPSKTGSANTASSTAAAPTNVGSTLALFGGLAMAVFAL